MAGTPMCSTNFVAVVNAELFYVGVSHFVADFRVAMPLVADSDISSEKLS